ncbi:MAG: hypothetical protein H8E33_05475 [Candidatus Cloacimonetes bacterium]|nr:hypothetical protein [Candidatus Cloacimonadota bacterium]
MYKNNRRNSSKYEHCGKLKDWSVEMPNAPYSNSWRSGRPTRKDKTE